MQGIRHAQSCSPVLMAPAMLCSVMAGRLGRASPLSSRKDTNSPSFIPASTVTYKHCTCSIKYITVLFHWTSNLTKSGDLSITAMLGGIIFHQYSKVYHNNIIIFCVKIIVLRETFEGENFHGYTVGKK